MGQLNPVEIILRWQQVTRGTYSLFDHINDSNSHRSVCFCGIDWQLTNITNNFFIFIYLFLIDAALTAVGVGAGVLGQQAQDMVKEYLDSDVKHSATVRIAKFSGDPTLGGADGHLSGVVEKCALADGVISEGGSIQMGSCCSPRGWTRPQSKH